MIRAHDFLWPEERKTWNDWEERTFAAHCMGWNHIGLAGGSGIGKSRRVGKIAALFWLAAPRDRAAIVASTTLEGLETRIWGYIVKLLEKSALPLPIVLSKSKPPKWQHRKCNDRITGLFATAVKEGDESRTISSLIGRHPEGGIMFVLDESPDMNMNVAGAFSNLSEGTAFWQVIAIGNSDQYNDLHGALCTPKVGWDKIDPMRDDAWETTRENGICLYFNPYKSPAITEVDPEKRERLSRFLPTLEKIEKKKRDFGENSETFWRFTLGFWKTNNMDRGVMSEPFLREHAVFRHAEWSGFHVLNVVAGLDPEFQIGGTGCLLRLAILGQMSDGSIGLDYREQELLFRIRIQMDQAQSNERQIALQVLKILREYNCRLQSMVVDVTGVGRALPELIKVIGGETEAPMKISSARSTGPGGKVDPSIIVKSPSDMWFKFREFVQQGQIRGLDKITIQQLTGRLTKKRDDGKAILESKTDYKARMSAINPALAHSPDEADSAILAHQAAILRFGFLPGEKRELKLAPRNFYTERQFVLDKERELAALRDQTVSGKRAPLVPNFSGTLGDLMTVKRRG